jgi:hypothetical protein
LSDRCVLSAFAELCDSMSLLAGRGLPFTTGAV